MYDYQYHGYWFYSLRNNILYQAIDLNDEYCLLNCPQEFEGPFENKQDGEKWIKNHPNAHNNFIKFLQEYYEYCSENQEFNINDISTNQIQPW